MQGNVEEKFMQNFGHLTKQTQDMRNRNFLELINTSVRFKLAILFLCLLPQMGCSSTTLDRTLNGADAFDLEERTTVDEDRDASLFLLPKPRSLGPGYSFADIADGRLALELPFENFVDSQGRPDTASMIDYTGRKWAYSAAMITHLAIDPDGKIKVLDRGTAGANLQFNGDGRGLSEVLVIQPNETLYPLALARIRRLYPEFPFDGKFRLVVPNVRVEWLREGYAFGFADYLPVDEAAWASYLDNRQLAINYIDRSELAASQRLADTLLNGEVEAFRITKSGEIGFQISCTHVSDVVPTLRSHACIAGRRITLKMRIGHPQYKAVRDEILRVFPQALMWSSLTLENSHMLPLWPAQSYEAAQDQWYAEWSKPSRGNLDRPVPSPMALPPPIKR
jgi:hypothetical protein